MVAKFKSYEEFPALMGAKDLEQIFPLSRAGVYNLINSEGFPFITVGTRKLIPKEALIDWINKNTTTKDKTTKEAIHG